MNNNPTGQPKTPSLTDLSRRVERALGDGDAPRLSLEEGLEALLACQQAGEVEDSELRQRLARGVEQLLRRTRPDGSLCFGPTAKDRLSLLQLRQLATWCKCEPAQKVLDWWKAPRDGQSESYSPPPLPSDHSLTAPFSVLRADWSKQGDWIAIDHRGRVPKTLFELAIRGTPLLGPNWSVQGATRAGTAKVVSTRTGAFADLVEWSFTANDVRHTRTVVMLRGRQLALIADQVEETTDPELTLDLYPGTRAARPAERSYANLTGSVTRASARLLPLCPQQSLMTDTSGCVSLKGQGGGGTEWLPLVLSWGRHPTFCKPVTVSERGQICPGDVAVGYRLAWPGGAEGLLVYRSLAKPALRAVLGHQTRVKFLVARFTTEGKVIPLLTIEE